MKGLKIVLCDDVRISIDDEIRSLNNYDFAVDSKTGIYYVVIPNEKWDEIRYDSLFIECLTTIAVMRIGTDTAEEKRDTIKVVLLSHNIEKEYLRDEERSESWEKIAQKMLGGDASDEHLEEKLIKRNYSKLQGAKLQLEKQYRMSLYDCLLSADTEEQMKYSERIALFEEWLPDMDDNDLKVDSFDAKKFIIRRKFVGMDELVKNDCGNSNFGRIWNKLDEVQKVYVNNNAEWKDLARFNREEQLMNLITARIKEDELKREAREREEVGGKLSKDDEISVKQIKKRTRQEKGRSKRIWSGGGSYYSSNVAEKKRLNGKKGVKEVKALLESQGFEVEDRTGDALSDGKNVDGNDSVGYDLEYNDGNVQHYIEVQACESPTEVQFVISKNEFETAERLNGIEGVKYQVICVLGINRVKKNYVMFEWGEVKADLAPENYCYDGVYEV